MSLNRNKTINLEPIKVLLIGDTKLKQDFLAKVLPTQPSSKITAPTIGVDFVRAIDGKYLFCIWNISNQSTFFSAQKKCFKDAQAVIFLKPTDEQQANAMEYVKENKRDPILVLDYREKNDPWDYLKKIRQESLDQGFHIVQTPALPSPAVPEPVQADKSCSMNRIKIGTDVEETDAIRFHQRL